METVNLLCKSLKESPLKNPENIIAIKLHAKKSKKEALEKQKKIIKKITGEEADISIRKSKIDKALIAHQKKVKTSVSLYTTKLVKEHIKNIQVYFDQLPGQVQRVAVYDGYLALYYPNDKSDGRKFMSYALYQLVYLNTDANRKTPSWAKIIPVLKKLKPKYEALKHYFTKLSVPVGEGESENKRDDERDDDNRESIYQFFSRSSEKKAPVKMGNVSNWRQKLSNFWPSKIPFTNGVFPSVEHAFHYAKLDYIESPDKFVDTVKTAREKYVAALPTKKAGEESSEWFKTTIKPLMLKIKSSSGRAAMKKMKIELRVKEWDDKRAGIMRILIKKRFKHDDEFRDIIMATGNHQLLHFEKGRGSAPSFWGGYIKKDTGKLMGKNTLGKIYMELRHTHRTANKTPEKIPAKPVRKKPVRKKPTKLSRAKKFDKEFQTRESLDDNNPLSLYYISLYEEKGKSDVAIRWLTKYGMFSGKKREDLVKKYEKLK
tara:strand:- start:5396 stop:6859 length:1464 start_codon:yes stop_codon:yes gene_type:complete